ncbi:MAG: UDP-N-acetylglucosamine 2-epimerase (non-hydrolyzing) [Bacteroidales bacterium]|nr:UDP-N-acetylglucosamine 2-epimerase (non-hydrolyzing) [Bacteroidales bacterium]
MKIITIVGARPQFIKAAAVSRAFAKHSQIEEIIVHTGQHFDANMSDIFFEEMQIPKPHYNLDINGLGHGAMTGQMLEKIEKVLIKENPDWVLVYGDTNSTLAGALAASKLHIKIAHVEAGLRSFNMKMPEEVNRILTDRISTILFCPTQTAIDNLSAEGYDNIDIKTSLCGDVMQDAAIFYAEKSRKPNFDIPKEFVLATIHRAENTDDLSRLHSIIDALHEIGEKTPIILPLHPRTVNIIKNNSIDIDHSKVNIIQPVGYLEMVYLLQNCKMVMSDSGGLQKEAFFFAKPCITLRDETEWVELVNNGFNTIVGADKTKIISTFHNQKFDIDFSVNLYGGGNAADKIALELMRYL